MVRDQTGKAVCYDPAENIHRDHILDVSIVPARIDDAWKDKLAQAFLVWALLLFTLLIGTEWILRKRRNLL